MSDFRECSVEIGCGLREIITEEEADALRTDLASRTGGMVTIIQPTDGGSGRLKITCGRTIFVDGKSQGKGKCAAAALRGLNYSCDPEHCIERNASSVQAQPQNLAPQQLT